ncbi:MAG: DUF5320 domain-containing protein [Candidatus Gracilibacteria bacterium]
MPNFDGTGPNGQGCGTGKKLGPCSENHHTKSLEEQEKFLENRLEAVRKLKGNSKSKK